MIHNGGVLSLELEHDDCLEFIEFRLIYRTYITESMWV